ncbi:MAG TPA: hypothetical protein PLD20_26500 [Blastocatellia bacterium]|nr:hypothetical protein [Blastocatellia bacterium]HMV87223.1 hypothetical protein [Blastocatellia bacterium]HMX29659.1 hypothetical protein [Blastocatellia bacterium]HMY72131.1 hypothetical protein [Blastocatellia bacterium]HMZ21512.1 hypothetical protein [Blastocatellia bacterium]
MQIENLVAERGGINVQFEIPAAFAPHRKVNEKHERKILLSVRLVADADLNTYLQSLPLTGPGWYGDWKCGPHERICVQHPRSIQPGKDVRVRITRECYRSNFWETRLTFEPLWKAVPDAAKWERIPLAESWTEAKARIEALIGELPIVADDDSLPEGQSASNRADRFQEGS